MFKKILSFLFKDLYLFTAAYSNNIFPDPLSKEEEEKCINELNNGSKEARNKLIEHNLRLIAHIVKKYEHKVDEADDLISIGTIGLIKGIDSYSGKKDTKLTTYCARCIENEILMYLRKVNKSINDMSLDDILAGDDEGNNLTLGETIPDPKPAYENIELENEKKYLLQCINTLNDREKRIMCMRYGLNGFDEQTQKEVADTMNISQSYISRLEKKILNKLHHQMMNTK